MKHLKKSCKTKGLVISQDAQLVCVNRLIKIKSQLKIPDSFAKFKQILS